MFMSLENASKFLPNAVFSFPAITFAFVGMFLLTLFKGQIVETNDLFIVLGLFTLFGFYVGAQVKYRVKLAVKTVFFYVPYLLFLCFLLAGAGSATLAIAAQRQDLHWFAFSINSLCLACALLIGMLREARSLGWVARTPYKWRSGMARYVDFEKHQVFRKVEPIPAGRQNWLGENTPLITTVIATNIPLMYRYLTAEKQSLIFIASPFFTATFAYLFYHYFGPALTRIFLLHQIEKSSGREFINPDYDAIQELRRSFFMARWFMIDYYKAPK